MSRGFVKEDDQKSRLSYRRAPLPDGVPNYVTPRGLRLLHEERDMLERSLGGARSDASLADYDLRRTIAELDGCLALLQERIVTAKVVEPNDSVAKRCPLRLHGTLQTDRRTAARHRAKLHHRGGR
ncbi:MAG: hypothetical protein IPJ85_17980 [Flavobacteriales bacterium]|nr:hypothetical protein [Flavobacteriales bacterium]